MSLHISHPVQPRSVAALAAELSTSLITLRDALRVTFGLVQQLEHHSSYTAALAQGQPVRIKRQKSPPLANGKPRSRGRPPGSGNFVTIFATPAEIERLRAQPLAADP